MLYVRSLTWLIEPRISQRVKHYQATILIVEMVYMGNNLVFFAIFEKFKQLTAFIGVFGNVSKQAFMVVVLLQIYTIVPLLLAPHVPMIERRELGNKPECCTLLRHSRIKRNYRLLRITNSSLPIKLI